VENAKLHLLHLIASPTMIASWVRPALVENASNNRLFLLHQVVVMPIRIVGRVRPVSVDNANRLVKKILEIIVQTIASVQVMRVDLLQEIPTHNVVPDTLLQIL
jgi:hypothetical protein